MQETQVQSLGWEDPLEEEMATHSSILDGKIPWTEESCGPQSIGSQKAAHDSEYAYSMYFQPVQELFLPPFNRGPIAASSGYF